MNFLPNNIKIICAQLLLVILIISCSSSGETDGDSQNKWTLNPTENQHNLKDFQRQNFSIEAVPDGLVSYLHFFDGYYKYTKREIVASSEFKGQAEFYEYKKFKIDSISNTASDTTLITIKRIFLNKENRPSKAIIADNSRNGLKFTKSVYNQYGWLTKSETMSKVAKSPEDLEIGLNSIDTIKMRTVYDYKYEKDTIAQSPDIIWYRNRGEKYGKKYVFNSSGQLLSSTTYKEDGQTIYNSDNLSYDSKGRILTYDGHEEDYLTSDTKANFEYSESGFMTNLLHIIENKAGAASALVITKDSLRYDEKGRIIWYRRNHDRNLGSLEEFRTFQYDDHGNYLLYHSTESNNSIEFDIITLDEKNNWTKRFRNESAKGDRFLEERTIKYY